MAEERAAEGDAGGAPPTRAGAEPLPFDVVSGDDAILNFIFNPAAAAYMSGGPPMEPGSVGGGGVAGAAPRAEAAAGEGSAGRSVSDTEPTGSDDGDADAALLRWVREEERAAVALAQRAAPRDTALPGARDTHEPSVEAAGEAESGGGGPRCADAAAGEAAAVDARGLEAALARLDGALAKLPTDASLHNNRAQCLRLLGRDDESRAALVEAVALGEAALERAQAAAAGTPRAPARAAAVEAAREVLRQAWLQRAVLASASGDAEGKAAAYGRAAKYGSTVAAVIATKVNPYATLCGDAVAHMLASPELAD